MKKKLTTILAVLMVLAITFSGSVTAYAKKASDDGLYVKIDKSYVKDNKTCFPVTITNRDGYYSLAKFQLHDSSGKLLDTWKDVPINAYEQVKRNLWCDMRNYPAGYCYFDVYLRRPWDRENWYHWRVKIYNSTGGITFKQTALRRLDDGRLVPKISVNYKNVKGKHIYLEIQDDYGNTIYKYKSPKPLQNKNGSYWFSWGGRVGNTLYPSGYYHVRVACTGVKWKSMDTYLDFSQAR